MPPHNQPLHDALERLTQEVWQVLSNPEVTSQLRIWADIPTGFVLPRSQNTIPITRRQALELVLFVCVRLQDTGLWRNALDALQQDQVIGEHLNVPMQLPGTEATLTPQECLMTWIAKFIYDNENEPYSSDTFSKHYSMIEKEFHKNTITCELIYGLLFFNMERSKVDIDQDMYITLLTDKDRSRIRVSLPIHVSFTNSLLHVTLELPKLFGSDSPSKIASPIHIAREKVETLFSALRLFKTGGISYSYSTLVFPAWFWDWGQESYSVPMGFGRTSYYLAEEDIISFQQFWKEFQEFQQKHLKNELSVAIRRFGYAQERLRTDDKIIDCLTALESILTEDAQDVKYKLWQRTAALLGITPDERIKIANHIRVAYDARSSIVHGRAGELVLKNVEPNDPEKFTEIVEDYVRKTIKHYIYNYNVKSVRVKTLDEMITRGYIALDTNPPEQS